MIARGGAFDETAPNEALDLDLTHRNIPTLLPKLTKLTGERK